MNRFRCAGLSILEAMVFGEHPFASGDRCGYQAGDNRFARSSQWAAGEV